MISSPLPFFLNSISKDILVTTTIHAIHVPEISQSEGARLSAQPGQILAGNEGV